ncbi:MAG: hypothetical protein AAF703_16045 [Cyanobacteria bacterium P01_D01_bin.105]
MSFSTIKSITFIGKAALGLTLAMSLSPIGFALPADAQMSRSAQPQRSRVVRPPARATTPTFPPMIISPQGGQGPTPADSAGSCNGVSDCNNFIANCIGSGGDYIPGTTNDEGQPTSGSCEVE